MVSIFRAAYDQRLGDPAFEAFAKRLRDECPEFGAWWTTYDIKMPTAGAKTVRPPGQLLMQLRHATFQSNDDPALRLLLMSLHPKVEETPPPQAVQKLRAPLPTYRLEGPVTGPARGGADGAGKS
ncbi:MAG: hypothetical protein JO136_17985 [Hyphomicrobiales bacterium]|nr:hypothetical protein [Hyphomicrobiales bacterium]